MSDQPDLEAMRRLPETAQDCAEVAQGLLTVVEYAATLARDLAAADRERDEALTERADFEVGLTLCQSDLAAARAGLERYGRHDETCAYVGRYANRMAPPECDCSLAAALADAPQRTPAGSQTACGAEGEVSGMEGTA